MIDIIYAVLALCLQRDIDRTAGHTVREGLVEDEEDTAASCP